MTTGKKLSLIVSEVADNNKGALCRPLDLSAPRKLAVRRFLKLHEPHFSFLFPNAQKDKSTTPHH